MRELVNQASLVWWDSIASDVTPIQRPSAERDGQKETPVRHQTRLRMHVKLSELIVTYSIASVACTCPLLAHDCSIVQDSLLGFVHAMLPRKRPYVSVSVRPIPAW